MPRRDLDPENTCHRACDRCRRKKIKCDPTQVPCSGCRSADHACTFDIPAGRRGPIGKSRRQPSAVDTASSSMVDVIASPPLSFNSPVSRVDDPHASPGFLSTQYRYHRSVSLSERWTALSSAITLASSSSTTLEAAVNHCADLFFDYLHPATMSVHMPSYRASIATISQDPSSMSCITALTFTLITAVCAKVCFFVPMEVFPLGETLGEIFLDASRSCLKSFGDVDAEYPCADSITVRYLQSNCLHACARPRTSWLVFGEAIRLVQGMRLHDERSYASLDAVESLKRRKIFWHVFIGDKSLSVLRGMPVTLSSHSFEEGISTKYPVEEDNELMKGFNAGIPLWRHAEALALKTRLLKDTAQSFSDASSTALTPDDHAALMHLYVRFATSLDDLPPHLKVDIALLSTPEPITANQFAPQITDLQMTYLSLKLYLVQKLEDIGYFAMMGEHGDMILLRKTEIAQAMVHFLQIAPFWSLKVNGEPCVEKIRLVGASLLAIALEEVSPLATRARRDLGVLLDILARLDSKASDALRRELQLS